MENTEEGMVSPPSLDTSDQSQLADIFGIQTPSLTLLGEGRQEVDPLIIDIEMTWQQTT